jgi:hypothetical protein
MVMAVNTTTEQKSLQEKTHNRMQSLKFTDTDALSGIRAHDLSVRASEDS